MPTVGDRHSSSLGTPTRRWRGVVVLLVLLWVAAVAVFGLIKADVADAPAIDLSFAWQTVWNVGHGHGFNVTYAPTGQMVSRLYDHADYLLVLLAPLAWFGADYRALIILQAMIGGGLLWLFWSAASAVLRRPMVALAVTIAALLYGPWQFAASWQFHPVLIGALAIMGMIEASVRHRRSWVGWLWFAMAVLSKEQVGVIAGITAWWLWRSSRRPAAWWGLIIGTVWTATHFFWIIPAARPGIQPNLIWRLYFGDLGGSIGTQARALLHPATILQRLWRPELGWNIVWLLFPLSWLPVAGGSIFLGALTLLPHWLSSNPSARLLFNQNHVLAVPFILWATVQTIVKLDQRWPLLIKRVFPAVIVFQAVIGSVLFSPWPWSWQYQALSWRRDPEIATLRQIARELPGSSAIAYTQGIPPVFSSRLLVYIMPVGLDRADYAVVWASRNDWLNDLRHEYFERMNELLGSSPAFSVYYQTDRLIVYQRRWAVPFVAPPLSPGDPFYTLVKEMTDQL